MKKKLMFYICFPFIILLICLGVGSYISSRAGSGDFTVSDGVLTKYSGANDEVTLPTNIKAIGNEAFSNNPFIKKVIIPEGVKTIDSRAFYNCKSLESVLLPTTLNEIGDSAFSGCSKLNDITLDSGLIKMGSGVFADCKNLKYVGSNSYKFKCRDGAIYNDDETRLVQYLAGYPRNVFKIPSTVKDIDRYTFWGADNLEKIDLSGSLKEIPEYSIANCTNLQDVILSTPTRNINNDAFQGDTSLKQVILPVSLSSISSTAFELCPDDMVLVCEESSYASSFCDENDYLKSDYPLFDVVDNNLKYEPYSSDVMDASTNDLALKYSGVEDFFYGSSNDAISGNSDVSGNSNDVSASNQNNNSNATQNEVNNEYSAITENNTSRIVSDRVFLSLPDMTAVKNGCNAELKPEEVVNSGDYLYYKSDIKEINLDDSINYIGLFCFARSSLEKIDIPENVEAIGYGAFYHCDNLTEVNIPDSVNNIGEHAFDKTPWFDSWKNNPQASDFLIVGNGVLIGYKGEATTLEEAELPPEVKSVAPGVF